VESFVARMGEERQMTPKSVAPEAMEHLVRYDWPGNVRELENVIERAFVLQEGHVIMLSDLPTKVRMLKVASTQSVLSQANVTIEELERQYMLQVLEQTGWHKKKAAAILGIDASTLYRKLQRYGICRPGQPAGSFI